MKYALVFIALALSLQLQAQTPTPTPPVVTSLSVSWNPVVDPAVTSYVVYASQAPVNATGKFPSPISFQVMAPVTNYTFTNLTDGVYYIAITAKNGVGLESNYSNVISAFIQSKAPPPPSGLKITSQIVTPLANRTSARVEWNTNIASKGKVFYGLPGKVTNQVNDSTLATNHKVKLTGLKKGQTYAYRIVARDKAGSATESAATFSLP